MGTNLKPGIYIVVQFANPLFAGDLNYAVS